MMLSKLINHLQGTLEMFGDGQCQIFDSEQSVYNELESGQIRVWFFGDNGKKTKQPQYLFDEKNYTLEGDLE